MCVCVSKHTHTTSHHEWSGVGEGPGWGRVLGGGGTLEGEGYGRGREWGRESPGEHHRSRGRGSAARFLDDGSTQKGPDQGRGW